MKKLRLRESVKNVLGVIALYTLIVVGVIAINARLGYLQENGQIKNADSVETTSANQER